MDSALKNVCFTDLPVNVHTGRGFTHNGMGKKKKKKLPINSFNYSSQLFIWLQMENEKILPEPAAGWV